MSLVGCVPCKCLIRTRAGVGVGGNTGARLDVTVHVLYTCGRFIQIVSADKINLKMRFIMKYRTTAWWLLCTLLSCRVVLRFDHLT
jgi:hypothetical protein